MSDVDVLLINPAMDTEDWAEFESLGLGYLSSMLNHAGYTSKILANDLNFLDMKEKAEIICQIPSKIYGFTVFQSTLRETMDIIAIMRQKGVNSHIILGGNFPTHCSKEIFERYTTIDSICIGEGEETLLELTRKITSGEEWHHVKGIAYSHNGTVVVSPPRPLIGNLDELPFPERIAFKGMEYYRMVSRSRGCYAHCTFCTIQSFYSLCPGPQWRGRSPQNVADEIEEIVKKFSVHHIIFSDDNFFGRKGDEDRIEAMVEELHKRNVRISFALVCRANDIVDYRDVFTYLAENGLTIVCVGIESGVQRVLNTFKKGTTVEINRKSLKILRDLGISFKYGFIMFDPYTTMDEVGENYTFLKRVGYCLAQTLYNRYMVFPGAPLAEKLRREGKITEDFPYYYYNIDDPEVEQLSENAAKCFQQCFDLDRKITTFKIKMLCSLSKDENPQYDWLSDEFTKFETALSTFYLEQFKVLCSNGEESVELITEQVTLMLNKSLRTLEDLDKTFREIKGV